MVSDSIAVPVLLITLGFVGLYTGWKRRRILNRMAAVDPTPVRQLDSPGTVELEGTATPVDEPFTEPITGRDAVVAAWKVEEWDERGDRGTWREVARGVEAPAFELDDGTGAVDVAPVSKRETAGKWTQTTGVSATDGVRLDDVLVEFDSFPVRAELGPDEEPPDGVRRLHRDHDLYEDTGSITNAVDVGKKHGRRRYFSRVVEPGDETYVLGHVLARDEPHRDRFRPEDAVVCPPDDGLFVLSNQNETRLEAEFDSSATTRLVAGAVSLVVGTVGALVLLGVF
jgi:hypothetical protein